MGIQKLAFASFKVYTVSRYIEMRRKTGLSVSPTRSIFMKVILLQDVDGLGKAGDLKEVANGYARNYLLPRQFAAAATPALLANHKQHVAAQQRKLEKQAESNRQQAERLSQVSLTFRARV